MNSVVFTVCVSFSQQGTEITVILRTWANNPYKVDAEGIKFRVGDDHPFEGLDAKILGITVTDIENCEPWSKRIFVFLILFETTGI